MSIKALNFLLIAASLLGYLEWGNGQSVFLLQAEWEMFSKGLADPLSVIHPFTMLPLLGQIALITTLFQKTPGRVLTYAGIGGIGLLLGLMLFIGVISLNAKIALSTLPFWVLAVMTIRAHRLNSRHVDM